MTEKCPFCGLAKFKDFCIDWQDNHYSKCLKCDFVFQNVYVKYDYSKNYWENVVDPDGIRRDLTKEKTFKLKNWYGGIIDFVNSLSCGKILDIGCGLCYLLSAIDDSWEKVGFEVTDDSFEFIRENFPEITLLSGDLECVTEKYGENTFDVVVCYHVLEHLAEPVSFFEKITSLVAEKGILVVGTPNIRSFCAWWFKGNYRLLGNGHLCMFSPKHLSQLFLRNNMKIKKIEYPYFETVYFNANNLLRLLNYKNISPPFYRNIMTFYGIKTSFL